MENIKVKELLKLPKRKWDKTKTYGSILVISTRRKHDSGYMVMCIIGCDEKQNPKEICSYCDDICWKFPKDFDTIGYNFRNDMLYPSGVIQFWSSRYDFEVGHSLSSTTITLVRNKNGLRF